MLFIKDKLTFKPYLHKKTLARGTIAKTVDNELILIDGNDWENSSSMKELNYYGFAIELNTEIDLYDGYDDPYDNPRYRMINQDEVVEYSVKKYNLDKFEL